MACVRCSSDKNPTRLRTIPGKRFRYELCSLCMRDITVRQVHDQYAKPRRVVQGMRTGDWFNGLGTSMCAQIHAGHDLVAVG